MPKNEKALKSALEKKIMGFFLESEGSIDTPRGISTWINEDLQDVRKALESLDARGLLKAHRTSSTVGYSCSLTHQALSKLLSHPKK